MTVAGRFLVLGVLYLAQGLPYGFQSFALPIFLRRSGVSLTALGFLGALALPWQLKPVWAPLVDRYGQTRRAWIVPLMGLLAATCAAAGLCDPTTSGGLAALLALVCLMNLFAATQDIAVDGLAVDLLGPRELGAGNTAQVVGYKLGMLVGGQLFVLAAVSLRWPALFLGLALVVLVALLATTFVQEPPRSGRAATPRIKDIVAALGRALVAPGSGWLLLFIGTYKIGETMADTMWKPWVVDAGFSDEFIGGGFGLTGMVTSILGSIAGGVLATRWRPERALWLPAAGRVLPLAGQALIAATGAGKLAVLVVVGLEHLFGGALTTVVFALMMSRVDRRIGASHYTLLAGIELFGKWPGAFASGPIAQHLGYPAAFGIAAALTGVLLVTIPPLARARAPA
jgi:MFS family permease